jgi:Ca2+-binding RTX toxin-like protein
MVAIVNWNFNDQDAVPDSGIRVAGSTIDRGGDLRNVRFDDIDGAGNFGWEARGWSTAIGFDANSGSFFKFTTDLTDYNNIQFSLEERSRDSGPTQFALAYQIGDGAIVLHQTSAAKQDNPVEFHAFDLSAVAGLQTLNTNDVIPPVSFYIYGFGQPANAPSGANWRIDNVTISGDILPPQFSIVATNTDQLEGNTGTTPFTFTVNRTADTSVAATVSYAITGSGANPTNAADFAATTGSIDFAAGELSKDVTINVIGDTLSEQNEEFTVTLTNATVGTIKTSSATGIIGNDDRAFEIAALNADQLEGDNGAIAPFTFTITRNGDTNSATTVQYSVTGSGTNPANAADFGGTLPTGTVTFAAGEASQDITIGVSGDMDSETAEDFTVTLSAPGNGEVIIIPTAMGTIQPDDRGLTIAATPASSVEGNAGTTPFAFTVTRIGNIAGTTTVDYTVVGSGTNPADAVDLPGALAGTVTFADGEISKEIIVAVNGDEINEPIETFTVTLSNPGNGETLLTDNATAAIVNDDATIAIAAVNPQQPEGDADTTPYTFTITRGGDISNATTVNYAVAGRGVNPADAADFGEQFPNGIVAFAAGETLKEITVEVMGDTDVERNETFAVILSNQAGAELLTQSIVLATIQNDDSTGNGDSGDGGGGSIGGGGGSTDDGGDDGFDNGSTPGSNPENPDNSPVSDFPDPPLTTSTIAGTIGNDSLSGDDNFNTAIGDAGDDFILGLGGDDFLLGDAGQDVVFGNQGNDWIDGGEDDDLIFGGQGDDAILGGAGNDGISGQVGNDRLEGGDGNDSLFGNVGDDSIKGNVGDDLIFAGQGDDTAEGNEGNDIISGDIGNDDITGNEENDILFGNAGNDRIQGNDGDDWLLGGQDNDTLIGGLGNDAIFGNLGDDLLTGGDGSDFFGFRSGDGNDIIADFQNGVDIIGLEVTFSFADLAITQVDANTQIVVSDFSITLPGINAASITEANFAFTI